MHSVDQILMGVLHNPLPRSCWAAIDPLARPGGAAVEPLIPLLRHPNADIQIMAARSLGRIGRPAHPATAALLDLSIHTIRSLRSTSVIGSFTMPIMAVLLRHSLLVRCACKRQNGQSSSIDQPGATTADYAMRRARRCCGSDRGVDLGTHRHFEQLCPIGDGEWAGSLAMEELEVRWGHNQIDGMFTNHDPLQTHLWPI